MDLVHLHGASIGEVKCLVRLRNALLGQPPFTRTRFVLTYTSLSAEDWLAAAQPQPNVEAFRYSSKRIERLLVEPSCRDACCVIAEKDRFPTLLALHSRSRFILNIEAKPPQSISGRLFERVYGSLRRVQHYAVENSHYANEIRRLAPSASIDIVGTLKMPTEALLSRQASNVVAFVSVMPHEIAGLRALVDGIRRDVPDAQSVIIPRYVGAATMPWRRGSHSIAKLRRAFPMAERYCSATDLRAALIAGRADNVFGAIGRTMEALSLVKVAIMGGSMSKGLLTKSKGHNFLEPLALGVPTLVGTHHANWTSTVEAFVSEGTLVRVPRRSMAERVARLLADSAFYESQRRAIESSSLLAFHRCADLRLAQLVQRLATKGQQLS